MWSRPPLIQLSFSLALVMLPVSGCSHADHVPTVAQAEQRLTEQMSVLVIQVELAGARNIKMTFQDERSFHCPKGKVRHGATFTGSIITSERKLPTQLAAILLGVTEMARLVGEHDYKITYVRGGDPTTRLYNATTRTNLTLDSPGPDRMVILGSTDCLGIK